MIRRLKVQGYKSLKNIEIFFEPVSIIFGPNAAGKSNVLDALNLVRACREQEYQTGF
jgi:AAA15 family ATPase/GTPase